MAVRHALILLAAALTAAPMAASAKPHAHPTSQGYGGAARQPHGRPGSGKTIEIEDYTFDIEQTLDVGSRGKGAGAGKVNFNAFQVTRKSDQASPRLLQSAATGEALQTIVLNTTRRGKRVKVKLHNVTVTGYRSNGGRETFTLHPASGEIGG